AICESSYKVIHKINQNSDDSDRTKVHLPDKTLAELQLEVELPNND
ncbi:10674_t:CDS:1, partial [Funneliformis mosseae]